LAVIAIGLPVAASAQAPPDWPQPNDCANISPQVQRSCIGRRIERKQKQMESLYPRALAQVRRGSAQWGSNDNRLHPRFFVAAQRDWRRFVQSNCTAAAAFGGGSNSSITDRFMLCYEQEVDRRIALFRQMADGSYNQ
jgi:uncharacterized protein YecT (DUF1311 family)